MSATQNTENMSFKDYYKVLKTQHANFRNEICHKLEISYKTFYVKLNDDTFSNPEKLVISQIMKQPIETLFP